MKNVHAVEQCLPVENQVSRWCFEVDIASSVLDTIEEKYNSCLCPLCLKEISENPHRLI